MVCSQVTYGSQLCSLRGDDHPSPLDLQEVMALGEDSKPNLEDLDWRISILEWMVEGKLPTGITEARRIA
jgi:hypothetical protein